MNRTQIRKLVDRLAEIRKLEKELDEKKEKLNEILEVSNTAYEARDAGRYTHFF